MLLTDHPLRQKVLAELHARPIHPVVGDRRVICLGFLTNAAQAVAARETFAELCRERGCDGPLDSAKHHRVALPDITLTWETHGEFTTFTWDMADHQAATPFTPAARSLLSDLWGKRAQPGDLLIAIDAHLIRTEHIRVEPPDLFDQTALAISAVYSGKAVISTDFKADDGGFVRILIENRGMDLFTAGGTLQRVLEIETYRTLALLGLPEAQRLQPSVNAIESALPRLLEQLQSSDGLETNNALLDHLTALSTELEKGASESLFRFGATRAYEALVLLRLEALAEEPVADRTSWSAFLARRMKPAMRTCATMEERQANLSRKLTRAAQLLRTRVDIEREKQNSDLLHAMNERGRLQLRLQQTVEGLSVAAISYYVVGLFGYLAKGAKDFGIPLDVSVATAVAVPLSIICVWAVVRHIRKAHSD